MRARLRIKTTQIPPLFPVFQYSSIPISPFLTLHIPYISLHIPLSFAHCSHFQLAELQKKLAGERSIVVFFFFSNFRVYQRLSVPGPKKRSINWSQKRSKRCSIVQGSSGPVHFYSMPRFH